MLRRLWTPRKQPLAVNLEKLKAMPPDAVIDVTPYDLQEERGRLWRGASLGALALNLAAGDHKLNTRNYNRHADDNEIWFTTDYDGARGYAEDPNTRRQFTPQHAADLGALTGVEVPDKLPTIVYSVEGTPKGVERVGDRGDYYFSTAPVPFQQMDPHSRAAVEEILGVQVPPPRGK